MGDVTSTSSGENSGSGDVGSVFLSWLKHLGPGEGGESAQPWWMRLMHIVPVPEWKGERR